MAAAVNADGVKEYTITSLSEPTATPPVNVPDPSMSLNHLAAENPADAVVLEFEYTSDVATTCVDLYFSYVNEANGNLTVGPIGLLKDQAGLEETTEWKTYTCNCKDMIDKLGWGEVDHWIRLDPAKESGVMKFRNIKLRSMTVEENEAYLAAKK